jgi:hypothetical protein
MNLKEVFRFVENESIYNLEEEIKILLKEKEECESESRAKYLVSKLNLIQAIVEHSRVYDDYENHLANLGIIY